ncbi:MAG: CAP domain-containing protein [Chloroflexota bacterium]
MTKQSIITLSLTVVVLIAGSFIHQYAVTPVFGQQGKSTSVYLPMIMADGNAPLPDQTATPAPTADQPAPTPTTTEPISAPTEVPTAIPQPPKVSPTVTPTQSPPSPDLSMVEQIVKLTNEERAKKGCPALKPNQKLNRAAQKHSNDMMQNGFFSHTGSDGSSVGNRVKEMGYSYRRIAENIARGYRSPEAVMEGWMNSSGHRANILNCSLREIGVGYTADDGSRYGPMWTQNFATPR